MTAAKRILSAFLLTVILTSFLVTVGHIKEVKSDQTQSQEILPPPSLGNMTLEKAISRRMSIRSWGWDTSIPLTSQEISQILWAAYGYSLNGTGQRTVPSVNNTYSMMIYASNATAVYVYNPADHSLSTHTYRNGTPMFGDYRIPIASYNGWAAVAPLLLVVVWNSSRMSDLKSAAYEAGCIGQNIYIEAASRNLGTTLCGGIDQNAVRDTLDLDPSSMVALFFMPISPIKSGIYPQDKPPTSPSGNLPAVKYSNTSLDLALSTRQSIQEWSNEELSSQEWSQILWAAYGYSLLGTGHSTVPSANALYPMVIYAANQSGVYRYFPVNHSVAKVLDDDKRLNIASAVGGQTWASKAPLILLTAWNTTKLGELIWASIEAGCIAQEVYLESTAWNLGTVRMSDHLDENALRQILGLPSEITPLFIMPVGHLKPVGQPKYDVVFTVKDSAGYALLKNANVTIYNGASLPENKIKTGITASDGKVRLTDLLGGILTITVYDTGTPQHEIANVTRTITTNEQQESILCTENKLDFNFVLKERAVTTYLLSSTNSSPFMKEPSRMRSIIKPSRT